MAYLSDIEIAQACKMKPIAQVARALGIGEDDWEPYGKYKAKLDLSLLNNHSRRDGKLLADAGDEWGRCKLGAGFYDGKMLLGDFKFFGELALGEPRHFAEFANILP